jgi:hypothetical protein
MRNLIILGSGRSGTSAAASLFRNVPGVFYGYDILPQTVSNPSGYFEDEVVNALNNVLLRQMTGTALLDLVPERLLPWVEGRFPRMHRDTRALWIARPRRRLPWRLGYELAHLMGRIAAHRPFCLKDPRFCFTLPLWRSYLPDDVRFLVVVRNPQETIRSMLQDARALYGDRPLPLTEKWARGHWQLAHETILEQRAGPADGDRWLIVTFDDILAGNALPAISAFAECEIDAGMIRRSLARQRSAGDDASPACARLYRKLCAIADDDLRRWGGRS